MRLFLTSEKLEIRTMLLGSCLFSCSFFSEALLLEEGCFFSLLSDFFLPESEEALTVTFLLFFFLSLFFLPFFFLLCEGWTMFSYFFLGKEGLTVLSVFFFPSIPQGGWNLFMAFSLSKEGRFELSGFFFLKEGEVESALSWLQWQLRTEWAPHWVMKKLQKTWVAWSMYLVIFGQDTCFGHPIYRKPHIPFYVAWNLCCAVRPRPWHKYGISTSRLHCDKEFGPVFLCTSHIRAKLTPILNRTPYKNVAVLVFGQ